MKQILKKYQDILQLNDWEISLTEEDGMTVEAETKCLFNDYSAIIRMNKKLSDEEKERTLIHELLHLIFRDAYDIFCETVTDEFAREYCTRQHERAIKKTAKIIFKLSGGKMV